MTRRRPPRSPSGSSRIEGRTADRVVRIIEELVDVDGGLRMSEVARRCGLPKSTVARALVDLVELGVVARVCNRYVPGARTLALAARVDLAGPIDRQSLILPSLLRLREETGLAAAFSTLRYGQVCFEAVLYTSGAVDATSTIAPWAPAHCTSSGKVLLAYSPHAARCTASNLVLAAFTPRTIVEPDELEAELVRVRHDGVAYNDREYLPEVSSIAVPVIDARLGLFGALAVCGSASDITRMAVGSALRRAASSSIVAVRREAGISYRP